MNMIKANQNIEYNNNENNNSLYFLETVLKKNVGNSLNRRRRFISCSVLSDSRRLIKSGFLTSFEMIVLNHKCISYFDFSFRCL